MALQSDKDSKKTASALANARLCVEFLDEMPWVCAKTTARDLERLIAEWNPVKEKKVVRARADPMLEALDPSSALARQLKALGWTPPVPGEQQLQPPRQVEQDAMQAVEQQQPAMAVDAQQGQDSAQQPMPFSFSPSVRQVLFYSHSPSSPLTTLSPCSLLRSHTTPRGHSSLSPSKLPSTPSRPTTPPRLFPPAPPCLSPSRTLSPTPPSPQAGLNHRRTPRRTSLLASRSRLSLVMRVC